MDKSSAKKILGVLGGLGPEATLFFYQLLLKHTPAEKDQDHIPTLIYSNSQIPNRQTAIQTQTYRPVIDSLTETIASLHAGGADFFVVPCNTAHFFLDQIQNEIKLPFIHMIQEAADFFNELENLGSIFTDSRIGLLATHGVYQTRIYQQYFQPYNLQIVTPPTHHQDLVHKTIFEIKSTSVLPDHISRITTLIDEFRSQQEVDWIILACTELSVLYQNQLNLDVLHIFDPLRHLAQLSIQYALAE